LNYTTIKVYIKVYFRRTYMARSNIFTIVSSDMFARKYVQRGMVIYTANNITSYKTVSRTFEIHITANSISFRSLWYSYKRRRRRVADPKRQQELQLWKQRCEVGNPTRREEERERKREREERRVGESAEKKNRRKE